MTRVTRSMEVLFSCIASRYYPRECTLARGLHRLLWRAPMMPFVARSSGEWRACAVGGRGGSGQITGSVLIDASFNIWRWRGNMAKCFYATGRAADAC
jgi:hypothetical protein